MRLRLALVVLLASVTLTAQSPDRAKPPAVGPAPTLKLPNIQKRQLTNGLPVWIVELHEVPVAQVNLVVQKSGTADDPEGKYGIASLTTAMLTEGAGARTSLEIADAIDFLGADLGAGSGFDSSAVRLHVPVARLQDALPIMADVALRPTFPQDELERARQQRLTSILQARDDPASIGALAFARVLYGTHRFGTSTIGTAEAIKIFTADDLKTFYTRHFVPSEAALIVVGDVTPDRVVPLLETSFGAWKAPTVAGARPGGQTGPARARREIYLVDKPGAPQTQIRIGAIGVDRATPDYFPIQVMNTVLGGSFSSRLNLNLREKHGYTYGANSGFDMRAEAGPFVASAGVQTDKTAESLTEFFNELNAIQQPVPADELARAKNYVSLRFPSGFETSGDISRRLEEVLVYHLPDDYFSRYVQNIEGVTAADVQRVAKKYIQPDRVAIVVTGDRKVIEPAISALKLGPLNVLTVDQVFAPAPVTAQKR
jgi:zinc protease